MREAASMRSNLVCLPEHWLARTVVGRDNEIYARFSKLARELGIYLNLGGIYENDVSVHLTSPTFSPQGELISNQRKVHLYRGEKKRAVPGNKFTPFSCGNFMAGTLVCHDVVFPESARTQVLRGAEILLNPSLIVAAGMEPWEVYLTARALENRVPVVAPNAVNKKRFLGGSLILTLDYNRTQNVMEVRRKRAISDDEDVITASADLDYMVGYRKERFAERVPSSYEEA